MLFLAQEHVERDEQIEIQALQVHVPVAEQPIRKTRRD